MIQTCKNPIYLIEKDMYVPCGHCEACKQQRMSRILEKLDLESKVSKSVLFFTLTYDNDNIPTFTYQSDDEYTCNRDNLLMKLDSVEYSHLKKSNLFIPQISKNNNIDTFGVCYKKDIQKFIKRLRRKIEYDKNKIIPSGEDKTLRYFVVSEYGPETYRPHYHGLLFFKSQYVADSVERFYFSESWKLCNKLNKCIERVITSASSYCAKYVVSNNSLPSILRVQGYTAPFYLSSRSPSLGSEYFNYLDIVSKVKRRSLSYIKSIDTQDGSKSIEKQFSKSTLSSFFEQPYRHEEYSRADYSRFFSEVVRWLPKFSYQFVKQNTRQVVHSAILKTIDNKVKLVNDNLLLLQNNHPSETFTLQHLYNNIADFNTKIYGIPQNRRVLAKAIYIIKKYNISLVDYIINYHEFHNLKFSLSMQFMYQSYNQMLKDKVSYVDALRYIYPSYYIKLPKTSIEYYSLNKINSLCSQTYIENPDRILFNNIKHTLHSFHISVNELYPTTFKKDSKDLSLPIKVSNVSSHIFEDYHKLDDVQEYYNYLKHEEIIFTKNRNANHALYNNY